MTKAAVEILQRDVRLRITNAKIYAEESTRLYREAEEMHDLGVATRDSIDELNAVIKSLGGEEIG